MPHCFRISVVSLLTPALHRPQRVLLPLINSSTFSKPDCSDWDSALQIPIFAPDVLPAVATRKQYAICTLWVFCCLTALLDFAAVLVRAFLQEDLPLHRLGYLFVWVCFL